MEIKLASSAANQMERILTGERLKYTVRIHLPDRSVIEFQAQQKPILDYSNEDRCLWLKGGEYPHHNIMRWPEGAIMLVEENKNGQTT